MNQAPPASCQSCLRPINEQERIQWVSYCRCARPYAPNSQFSIEICANCKRRVAAYAKEKVSRTDLCSCEKPDSKRIASQIKPNQVEEVTLDLASIGLPPERFPSDKFTPIALLGDTPRSLVLLCRDKARSLKVAVKLFKSISPAFYSTFESEVRKNKQLSHVNIARIVDSGIHNGKTPYLVTEYKEGFNLEQCLSIYGTPSYDVMVNILLGICQALDYAQKQGVMHRDLRPGNIIFLDDMNSQPSICITDFALPKVKASEELQVPWFALFMTADEARGIEYSEKSEVYALGCIGYVLLTGRPPFVEGSALDIKNSHALKLPPRISSLKFDNTRPGDLDEVIEKCLEKDPRDRFDSVAKLQERLEVFPRRVQMQIAAIAAAKQRAKVIRISVGAVIALALSAAVFFAITHH